MFFVEAPVVSHGLGEISNKTVKNTITENIVKQELGLKYYILRDEESYIMVTTEIEFSRGLTRDATTIYDELQKVLHGVDCQDVTKTITLDSAIRYA